MKLTPPETPRTFVPRPAVVERLDEVLSRRLTTVVAGPGFGKSTLLSEWARSRDTAWYTVDAGDESLSGFARGVADALRLRVPLVSVELSAAIDAAGGGDTRERADALAALVAQAIEDGLDDDLVLVLDDVQELGRSSSSARFLAVLCRQAPARLHVVLSSRREAPFPTERLRGRRCFASTPRCSPSAPRTSGGSSRRPGFLRASTTRSSTRSPPAGPRPSGSPRRRSPPRRPMSGGASSSG